MPKSECPKWYECLSAAYQAELKVHRVESRRDIVTIANDMKSGACMNCEKAVREVENG